MANPGAMAASPTPRKNLAVMSPEKPLEAAWHMTIAPQTKLHFFVSYQLFKKKGLGTNTESARYFPSGKRTMR
jgi:hypothetical protein